MGIKIDPSSVLRYLKIAENAQVSEDARLSVADGLQGRTIRAVKTNFATRLGERIFRGDSDRDSYRAVRRDFLDCLRRLYGVEKDSDLPPMVLAAFQKGEGVTGRPLTKRRITYVLDAVRRDLGFGSLKTFRDKAAEAAQAKPGEGETVADPDVDESDDLNADETSVELPQGLKTGIGDGVPVRDRDAGAAEKYNQFRTNISGVVRGQEADELEMCFRALQKTCDFDDSDLIFAGNNPGNASLGLGVKQWLRGLYESLSANAKKDHIAYFQGKDYYLNKESARTDKMFILGRAMKMYPDKEEMHLEDEVDFNFGDEPEGGLEKAVERWDKETDDVEEATMVNEDPRQISKDFEALRQRTQEPPKVTKPRYTFNQALEILKRLTKNTVRGKDVDPEGVNPGQGGFDDEQAPSEIRFDRAVLLSVKDGELSRLVKSDDENIKKRLRNYLEDEAHKKDIPDHLRDNVEETLSKMMDCLDGSGDYFSHERCVLLDADAGKERLEGVCRKLLGEVVNKEVAEGINEPRNQYVRTGYHKP